MIYDVEMRDEGWATESDQVEAETLADAIDQVRELAEEWVSGGDWGDDGASVEVYYTITDEEGEEVESDSLRVEIEPDHEALMRAVADDPDCEHDWTSEGEGGLKENPGVWGGSGTSLVLKSHCRKCGLHKTEYHTGSQRNPGEHDTVDYRQLDHYEIAQHRRYGDMD